MEGNKNNNLSNMSAINNYFKNFECDERTSRLVERILQEYKPLLRWIKNRPNKWGDDFKEDLYQYTMYNLVVNTYNRVHKHNMSDCEIIKYGPMSIYRAYADSVKNLPVNIRELREYPYSIDEDSDDSNMPAGHILPPTGYDCNLERSGEPSLDDLVDSLPCDDKTKKAILLIAQGYKQVEAAEAIGIRKNTLSMKLKALRESSKFKSWLLENRIDFKKMMQ